MSARRLLGLGIVGLGALVTLGWVCISSEISSSAQARARTQEGGPSAADERERPQMVIEARLLPGGNHLTLLPEAPGVVRQEGTRVTALETSFDPGEGVFYTYDRRGRHRVWLYAVIADERPVVTVAGP